MKNDFLKAMINNKGRLSEIELGESIGLNEDETTKIISSLLDEHKIEFVVHGACNYKPLKSRTK